MKITITNCWSYYNKGDTAILSGTVKLVRDNFPNTDISALAFDPNSFNSISQEKRINMLPMPTVRDSLYPLQYIYNYLSCLKIQKFVGPFFLVLSMVLMQALRCCDTTIERILSEIDQSDLVIAVGGNYLYSNSGYYIHVLPIFYSKFVRKKPTILLGHSIGPFNDASSKFISKLLLRNVDAILFREANSQSYVIDQMKMRLTNQTVSCDMALFLDRKNIMVNRNPKNCIGITVRPWLFQDPSLYNRYLESMAIVCNQLLQDDFEVFLVPFSSIPGGENDLSSCSLIRKMINPTFQNRLNILDYKYESPEVIIEKLSNLEFKIFICTRFHSVLLSALAGIPCVIISYQHFKAHGISEQIGLSKYLLDIETINEEALMSTVKDILNNELSLRFIIINNIHFLVHINERKIISLIKQLNPK